MRTLNSAKNMMSGIVFQILYALLGFVVRTVFIYTLGEEYLGINGLLGSIFTVLNLANLGLDSAIIYALYKPMAEGDLDHCRSLVRFYRNAYRIIGFVILGLGLCLIPFLDILAKGNTNLVDLRIIFLISLLETACSYWFFAYLVSVPVSDQKKFIETRVASLTQILLTVFRLLCLAILRSRPAISFYVYCALGPVFGIIGSLIRRNVILRKYPWIREEPVAPLDKAERQSIFKNVVGMSTNNICRVLNDGIDSTVISALVGISVTGIFSNYLVLKSYVYNLLKTFFNSISASVGNLCAVETKEKQESFFLSLQFFCFWVYGFGAICFFLLMDHFIAGVWLHDTKWLLTKLDVFLIAANFLIEGMAKSVISFRDAKGLYWQTRYRYIFSSVFNAVISIILAGPAGLGVTGALLGTTASLIIMVSYDPVLVYREIFRKKAGEYYRMYFRQMGLVLVTGAATTLACLPFAAYSFGNFLLRAVICLIIPNAVWFILFRKDPRFVYFRDTVAGLFRHILAKR